MTFTDSSVCAAIAKSLDVPLVLWTFSETRTGGRLRLNSFCGVNLASHTLTRLGKSLDNVHGAPDSVVCLERILELARAAAVVSKLSEAKILVVGDHPVGFDACNFERHELKSRFGVDSVGMPITEFIESVKALPDEVAGCAFFLIEVVVALSFAMGDILALFANLLPSSYQTRFENER